MSDLKPCPFCGGKAYENITASDGARYSVLCWDCGAETDRFDDMGKAVAAWNSRATPIPDTPEMVRAIDDAYEAGRKSAERTCHTEEAYGTVGNGCVLDRYKLPRCSECHYPTRFEAHGYKYCPNCGARVVGD